VFDYVGRQKLGGLHYTYFILKQLTLLPPHGYNETCRWDNGVQGLSDWLLPLVLELIYTAWDLESFAKDCGWNGPPFRWDEERRFLLRCELDAAFFHLYLPAIVDGKWKPARVAEGAVRDETPEELAELKRHFPTPRDAVDYIMDTFPIVRRKDEEKHGEYRTKRIVLEIDDEMAEATRTGKPYQTASSASRRPQMLPSAKEQKESLSMVIKLTDFISRVPKEVEAKVRRVRDQTRAVLQEALRTECRLMMRTPEDVGHVLVDYTREPQCHEIGGQI
jgi:hypothetical protein